MTTLKHRTIVISPFGGNSTLNTATGSQLLNTMAEQQAEGQPRKRQRLTHLTPEERMMRRKLKNRVAAQLARDRKREKMSDLEIQLQSIQEENRRLLEENEALRKQTEDLSMENTGLRQKLEGSGGRHLAGSVKAVTLSPESAALGFGSQQQDRTRLPHLTMTSTTCLSLLLTLSLTSLLCSKRSLIQLPPSTKTKVSVGRVTKRRNAKSLQLQPGAATKWWGPQQQSWNPSKNL